MDKIIDYLETAATDPRSPIYASDLVPPILDLCEIAKRQGRVCKIADLIQCDHGDDIFAFLLGEGWNRLPSGYWCKPGVSSESRYDIAIRLELDRALNELHETGG
jgi:hypothetical protein